MADRLSIITKLSELPTLDGEHVYQADPPTAVFENGKISAKLIEVHDIHSDYGVPGT